MSSIQPIQSTFGGDQHGASRRSQAMQPASGESRAVQQLRELPLGLIEPYLSQPRHYCNEAAFEALVGSIRERGVLRPVLVRPRPDGSYRLIVGERRCRAARLVGLQRIPALVCRYDDAVTLEVALIENMKRDDLSYVEQARVSATLANELGLTYQQVADRLGRSLGGVSKHINLLNLSDEILEFVERGELGVQQALVLLKAKDPEVRVELARKAVKKRGLAKERWRAPALEARARLSNEDPAAALDEDVPVPPPSHRGQKQSLGEIGLAVARAWGDVLGTEVDVRLRVRGQTRLEVEFDSPEAALYAADRLDEAVSQSSSGTEDP